MNDELTHQQQRFIDEYLLNPSSITKAAIRAGYAINSAAGSGSRLLAMPKIKTVIDDAQRERSHKLGISKERVLQELALVAFANIADVMKINEEGDTVIDLENLPRQVSAALSEVSISTKGGKNKTRTAKVKMSDKLSALTSIAKHLGMFVEKVEHSGTLTLEQLVQASLNEKEPEPE